MTAIIIFLDSSIGIYIFLFGGIFPIGIIWGAAWVISGIKSNKARKILIFSLVLLITFLFIICYLILSPNINFNTTNNKAILNASWGMSPSQVKMANDTKLTKLNIIPLPGLFAPDISDTRRFLFLVQNDRMLFGQHTEIHYDFFDKKLYRYVVFIHIANKVKADNTVLSTKIAEYSESIKVKETSSYEVDSYEWTTKDKMISYSLYKNNKKAKYKIVIRVTYIPIYNEIQRVVREEIKSYF